MQNSKENKKKLLFIVPNIIVSVFLMVFYFTNNEPGFPYSIIPSYFFGVIAAIFTMYVVHPRVKVGIYNRKSFRLFNIVILLLTILIIALLIMYKI